MSGASDTPLYFRLLIRLLRPFPDFDSGFMKPVRQRAVTLLALRPGARVLDVGCGPWVAQARWSASRSAVP
jgi:hypothetical protein